MLDNRADDLPQELVSHLHFIKKRARTFARGVHDFDKIDAIVARVVAANKRFDITLAEWARVLETLAARRPAAIMFDKLFDNPAYTPEDVQPLVQTLTALAAQGIPVVPIDFHTSNAVKTQHCRPLATCN